MAQGVMLKGAGKEGRVCLGRSRKRWTSPAEPEGFVDGWGLFQVDGCIDLVSGEPGRRRKDGRTRRTRREEGREMQHALPMKRFTHAHGYEPR